MPNALREFRKRYPQYSDIPDDAVMSRISLPVEFRKVFPEYNDFTDDQISNNLYQERALEQVSMFPPQSPPAVIRAAAGPDEVRGLFDAPTPSLAAEQERARARFRGKIGPRVPRPLEDLLESARAKVGIDPLITPEKTVQLREMMAGPFIGPIRAAQAALRVGGAGVHKEPIRELAGGTAELLGAGLQTAAPFIAATRPEFLAVLPMFEALSAGTGAVTEQVFDTPEYKQFFDTLIPLVGGAAAFKLVKARNRPREMTPEEWQEFGGVLKDTMQAVRRMQPDRALPAYGPSLPANVPTNVSTAPTLPPFRGTFAGPSPAPVPGARRGIPVPPPEVAEAVRRAPDARRALPAGEPAELAQVPRDVTGAEFQTIIPSHMETGEPLRTPTTPEALTEYRQRVSGQFVGAPAPIPLGSSSLERPIPQPGKVFGAEEGRPKLLTESLTEGKKEPVKFVHYTDLKPSGEGRVLLEAGRRGASKVGEEGRRLLEGRYSGMSEFQPVPAVSVYQKGVGAEPAIAARRTRLEGQGEFAIADVNSQQAQAFYNEGKALAKSRGMADTLADQMGQNYMERKLLEAGYDGYRNSRVMEGKSIVLFKDVEAFTPEAIGAREVQKRFGAIQRGTEPFAVLQAENPQNRRLSDAENTLFTKQLEEDLRARGHNFVPVQGNTQDVTGQTEHAFLVHGISTKDAIALAKKYNQAGILTREGLVDINKMTVNPGDPSRIVIGESARTAPYFTVIRDSAGVEHPFVVPVDFSRSLPVGGARPEELPQRQQRRLPFRPEEAAVQASLAKETAREEKLQRVLSEERKVPIEQVRAERERAKAEQAVALGRKQETRLVPRSRRGMPLAERVAERKRLERKVFAAERATRGIVETGLTAKMRKNLEKFGTKITDPFTVGYNNPSFIFKDGSGIVSGAPHVELADFAQGKMTIHGFRGKWKGPGKMERPASNRLENFLRQTGAVRIIYPEFTGEINIGLEIHGPLSEVQFSAVSTVVRKFSKSRGLPPTVVWDIYRGKELVSGEGSLAQFREAVEGGGSVPATGPFTLSANPITNPRAWEWIDETVGKPLIEKTIVRPLERVVGALPSNLRRQLVENPDVKLALHTARKEHGIRKNEIDALTKLIQSEKPDDARSIIIDRISRGVPEDLIRLSPSAFPHLSAGEYKRRLTELTQTMTSEMKALNLPIREEWLDGAKHWYPQLWQHREKLGARVIMGRVFGRGGRLSLTGKEKRGLKRRQVEIKGVSDKWHTLDTDGKPAESFNARADAESFVRENSGYFISYFEKGSRGLSTRKFDTAGERSQWAKKNKDSITVRKLWRDNYSLVEQISIEDAARLGLIEDAVYNLQTGAAPASSAVAKARALEQLSNTLAQSGTLSDSPVAGYAKSSEYGFSITPDLVKNPAIKRLSEGYVPRDVARSMGAMLSADRSLWNRVWEKFMSVEKIPRAFVTYLNPFRHVRQFAENELLLYLDNVAAFGNKKAQAHNFREFYAAEYGGKPTRLFREFMEDAAETEIGGWRASDLKMKEHLNAVMKKVNDAADAGQPLTLTEAFQTFVAENPKLFNNMTAVHDTALKFYRATDMAYKYHSYKWYRDHGRSREYAAERVQGAYFNYETMPPIVRSVSRFVPFRVSVPYQLGRIFANHLRNRPFQFAAKVGLTITAYQMFRDSMLEQAGYTQKDLDAMGKLAPKTHEIVLPMTDEQGRNISVNLKWLIPFGDVMDYEDLFGVFGSQREREKAVRGALPMIVQPFVTGIAGRTQWGQSTEPVPPPEKGIGNQARIWMRRGNAILDEARVGLMGQYWERIRRELQDKGETRALPWWEKAFISPLIGTTRRISKKETPALNTKVVWSRAQEVLEGGDGMKGVFSTISKYKSGDISEKVFHDNMERLLERSKEVFEMPVARDARRAIADRFYDAYSKASEFDPRQDKKRVPADVIARTRRFLLKDLKRYEFGRPAREEE